MTESATLQARLIEAEAALHELVIGRRIVQIGADADRAAYAPGDEGRLRAYIAELRVQLGQSQPRRAIGVSFR